jgi:transcriptional regulator with XRE-family HTH domain
MVEDGRLTMVNFDSPDLGEKVRQAREELGWSQTALAERAGLSNGYLSQIENGNVQPRPAKVRKLLHMLFPDDHEDLEVLIQKIVDKGYEVTITRRG